MITIAKRFSLTLLLLACLTANPADAQKKKPFVPFNAVNYPDSSFVVTTQTYSHGKCQIRLIQVKNISSIKPYSPFLCRAWLTIERKNKVLHTIYLDDIDAVGSYYGLFIPNRQPSAEFFAIVKFGDYDGRLYLVDLQGNLTEYPGGAYIVSRFEEFLLVEYYSDSQSIEVIDLKNGESLIHGPDTLPPPGQWYFNGKGQEGYYFYTSENSPDSMYICDIHSRQFVSQVLNKKLAAESDKISYDFFPPMNNDCGCVRHGVIPSFFKKTE
jgi:hypothetical protein